MRTEGSNITTANKDVKKYNTEVELKASNGMAMLIIGILLILAGTAAFVWGIWLMAQWRMSTEAGALLAIVGALIGFVGGPLLLCGLKVLKPNEALVLTLFGRYYGTLKGAGFFWVNPFCTAVNPAAGVVNPATAAPIKTSATAMENLSAIRLGASKKISLKAMTLSNDRQKINDQLGNPIIISTVVIWKVVNTARAVFDVDNYKEFLSIQCDSALRDIVRMYPYDNSDGGDNEKSLRGSSMEIVEKLKNEIQSKVEVAGLEIVEARITHLSYAEEIAAAMLQRQQASAIVGAKQLIVEGAVGIVDMALQKLNETGVVELDEERKAAMVSNLLVVLCGNKDAQPVVNSGSLY